jgi:hypothetical protein
MSAEEEDKSKKRQPIGGERREKAPACPSMEISRDPVFVTRKMRDSCFSAISSA